MVDVEFIAQVLQLINAAVPGFYPNQAAKVALRRLAAAGLMRTEDADLLIRADLLWRTIQGVLRLTVGETDKDVLPPASAEPLLKAAAKAGFKAVDSAELLHASNAVAQQVQRVFAQMIGGVSG
jgi:glutamate-ammonia-ligase adenylyltransferase